MKVNVLVTSAGTASAINVIKALRRQTEYSARIVAVDADETAPGLYLADDHVLIPACTHDDYIPALLQLCKDFQVQALYPIYSREIEIVAEHADTFAKAGVGLLLPRAEVVRLCNDKRQMCDLAAQLGLIVPRSISTESNDGDVSFPVFAKPNSASGTSGAVRIDDAVEWAHFKAKHRDLLYQEFIFGPEYTVDAILDQQSNLVVGAPRLRLAVKAGQSVKGETVEEPDLIDLCRRLCKAVELVGPCNVQFIRRGSEFVFIEVNPRYAAGGLMLTVCAGANLPLLALKLMLGESPEAPTVRPGVRMLRYWEEVFVDKGKRL